MAGAYWGDAEVGQEWGPSPSKGEAGLAWLLDQGTQLPWASEPGQV